MSTADIIARCEQHGIDYKRLHTALDSHDQWGHLVHSFVYLTVLGIVEDAMREAEVSEPTTGGK